jgi:hypothetical protein
MQTVVESDELFQHHLIFLGQSRVHVRVFDKWSFIWLTDGADQGKRACGKVCTSMASRAQGGNCVTCMLR